MKKALLIAAALAARGVLANRFGPKLRDIDREKRFEALPDNAPPKWMFRNVIAIHETTDKILKLLAPRPAEPPLQAPLPST